MMKYDGIEFDKVEDLIQYKKWVSGYIDRAIKEISQPPKEEPPRRRRKRGKNLLPFKNWTTEEENILYVLMKEKGFTDHKLIAKLYNYRTGHSRTLPAVMSKITELKKRRLNQ